MVFCCDSFGQKSFRELLASIGWTVVLFLPFVSEGRKVIRDPLDQTRRGGSNPLGWIEPAGLFTTQFFFLVEVRSSSLLVVLNGRSIMFNNPFFLFCQSITST